MNERQQVCCKIQQMLLGFSNLNSIQNKETEYVAFLYNAFRQQLEQVLNSVNHTKKYSVVGCFIHQKPIVTMVQNKSGNQKGAELGDILFVYQEEVDKKIWNNSLLLQAKKVKKFPHKILAGEKHQLDLYMNWPKFQYSKGGGSLQGKMRSVAPKTISSGAQYLLINQSKTNISCGNNIFWCSMPRGEMSADKTLSQQIVDFLCFYTGRSFLIRGRKDGWSQMICDLLDIAKESVFNLRPNYSGRSRISGNLVSFLYDEFSTFGHSINQSKNTEPASKDGLYMIIIKATPDAE